ncbi:uncharacterized protein LOC108274860 [Ictalurus punctatus]|uniref:Uncharacterized protein LOC108274860 n=1 Tax=Ictalurus punctatus TaxID=7998 RepID=A0A9F7RAU1_ICTPU|nr:uncharacterized protein LOC108274860 [Ictalurus punctatus]
MCRCVYLLMLVFSIFRRDVSSSSAVIVRPGENITLHCNISPSIEMGWYRLINDELTMIISATKGNLDKELAENYNKDREHFQPLILNNSGHGLGVSLSLIIKDIRQSDIGLYYCGAKHNKGVNFARAVLLNFTDVVDDTSGSTECWTPLISVCCALTLMLMLCLGVVYKQGRPSSSCMKCMKDNGMKEADLQYASLRHNGTSRERHTPTPNHVTYDTVAIKGTKSPRV